MTRHMEENEKKKAPITQTEAAEELGVSREHLNRVLNGHRQSRRLTRAYNDLVRKCSAN
jgi:plasmid maintenance system antidote protein VapI